jgi:predicted Zn-dependent protease
VVLLLANGVKGLALFLLVTTYTEDYAFPDQLKSMYKASLYIILSILTFMPILSHGHMPLETSDDSLRSELSIEKEELIGKMFVAYLREQNLIFPDQQVQEYIQSIGYKLALNANIKYFKPSFFVLDSPIVNASAFLGANIAIHSGLILLTDDESELAAVMSHEIAHIAQNHLLRQIAYQRKSLPLAVVGSLAAVLIGAPQLIIPVLSAGQQHAVNFTRDHEKEADRIGMQILAKSQYSPHGMPNMFMKMGANSRYDSKHLEYLLTHPLYENRVAETMNLAETYKYRQVPNSLNYEFSKIRIQVLSTNNLSELLRKYEAIYQQNPDNILLKYAYTYCLLKNDKIKQANQIVWQKSDNLMVQLLIAETKAHIDINAGIKDLEKIYALNSDSKATLFMLCEFLLQTKRIEQANKVCNLLLKFLTTCDTEPQAYEMLRVAASMLKKQSLVHYCNANWFALYGDLSEAFRELDKALLLLPKNSSEYRATIKLKQSLQESFELQKSI